MTEQDIYTNTVEDAAEFERHREQGSGDYEDDRPSKADLGVEEEDERRRTYDA